MKTPAFAFAALLGALIAAQPVMAETIAVTYSDLDLTTQQGQKELDRRVDAAARKVCGYDDISVGTRLRSREAKACYKDARKQIEKNLAAIMENKAVGG